MPASGEAGEVLGASVDLLHERRLGVDQAVVGKYAMNFRNDLHWGEDVLEDCLHDDSVDAAGLQGDGMRAGDQLGDGAPVEVDSDNLGVETVQTVADGSTAHDEYPKAGQHVEHP